MNDIIFKILLFLCISFFLFAIVFYIIKAFQACCRIYYKYIIDGKYENEPTGEHLFIYRLFFVSFNLYLHRSAWGIKSVFDDWKSRTVSGRFFYVLIFSTKFIIVSCFFYRFINLKLLTLGRQSSIEIFSLNFCLVLIQLRCVFREWSWGSKPYSFGFFSSCWGFFIKKPT